MKFLILLYKGLIDEYISIFKYHVFLCTICDEIFINMKPLIPYPNIQRVKVVKASLDLTGKILILIKEEKESWMTATERSATPLYTEKSSKVQF